MEADFSLAAGVIFLLIAAKPGVPQETPASSIPVSELIERGRIHLNSHEPDQARRVLEAAVARAPKSAAAWSLLADSYAQLGLEEKAIEGYRTALELHPALPDALYNLGILLMKLQRFDDAARYFQVLREQKPQDQDVLLLLAQCQLQLGRHREARQLAELAVAGGGGEPALLALANILQMEGRNQDVVTLLELRRKQYSASAKYLFTLGMSYYNIGSYSAARDLFSAAASITPSLAQAHYFKGNALSRLGRPDLALPPYAEAVRLAPDKYLYHFHYGLALSNLGQKDPGEDQLKRAVEIKGSFAPARYELARIYFESSRDNSAREQLEEAIKADPGYLSSYYLLSQVYSRLGMKEDAARTLEQFRTLQLKQHEEDKRALDGSVSGGPEP